MACKWFSVCPLRRLEREGAISSKWRVEYCESEDNWANCVRYQMDEQGKPHPYNMMPDGVIVEIEN